MRSTLGLAALVSTGLINVSLGHPGIDIQHGKESNADVACPIERMTSHFVDNAAQEGLARHQSQNRAVPQVQITKEMCYDCLDLAMNGPYPIPPTCSFILFHRHCRAFEQRRDIPDLSDWDGIKLKTQEHPPLAPCEDCFYHSGNGLEAVSGNCIRMLMSGICDMKKLSFARSFFYQFALDCEDGRCVQRAENSVDKKWEIYAVYPQKEVCEVFEEVCSVLEYHFLGKAYCNETNCYKPESCTNGVCRILTQAEFREFFNKHVLLGAIGTQIDEHIALPAEAIAPSDDDEKPNGRLRTRGWPRMPLPLNERSAAVSNQQGCGSETCIDDQGRSISSNANHFFLLDSRQDRYITIAEDSRIVIERSIGQSVAVDPQGKVKVSYPGLTIPGMSPRPDMTEATVVVHCEDEREVRVDAYGKVYRAEKHGPLVRIDEFGHVYSRDRQGRDVALKDNGRLEWSNQKGHRLVIDDNGVREQTGRVLASFDDNGVQRREKSIDDDSDDLNLEQPGDCNGFTDDMGRYVSTVDGNIFIDTDKSDWTVLVDETNTITILSREGRMIEINMNGKFSWFDPVVEHRITIDESEGVRDWDKLIYSFQDHKYPISREREVRPELEELVSKRSAMEANAASRLSSPAEITITRDHTTFIATETTNQLGRTVFITKEHTPLTSSSQHARETLHSHSASASDDISERNATTSHTKSNIRDHSYIPVSGVAIKSTETLWASISVQTGPSATAVSKEGAEIWTIDDDHWIVSDHDERVTLVDSNNDGLGDFLVKQGTERLGLFDKAGNAVIIDVRDFSIVYDEDDDGDIEFASLQGQARIRLAVTDGVGNRATSEAQGYFAMTDEDGDGLLDFVEVDGTGRLFMKDVDGNQLRVSWKIALDEKPDLDGDGDLNLIFWVLDNEGKLHMKTKDGSIMAISWKAFAMVMTLEKFGMTTYAPKPMVLVDGDHREIVMIEPIVVRDISPSVMHDIHEDLVARSKGNEKEDRKRHVGTDEVYEDAVDFEMIRRGNQREDEDCDEFDEHSNLEMLKRDDTWQEDESDDENNE